MAEEYLQGSTFGVVLLAYVLLLGGYRSDKHSISYDECMYVEECISVPAAREVTRRSPLAAKKKVKYAFCVCSARPLEPYVA